MNEGIALLDQWTARALGIEVSELRYRMGDLGYRGVDRHLAYYNTENHCQPFPDDNRAVFGYLFCFDCMQYALCTLAEGLCVSCSGTNG